MAVVAVSYGHEVDGAPETVIQCVIAATSGFQNVTLAYAAPNSVVLTTRYTPGWAIALGIVGALLFLIGLLFFLVKTTATISAVASPYGAKTWIQVQGSGPLPLTQRLEAALQPGAGTSRWAPDPWQRHELRYWDGFAWTPDVSNGGVQASDPVSAPPA